MAQLLFETTISTKMSDIDAAGVVFFARYFYFAHNAYEEYLNSQQYSIKDILQSACSLPIIHSEAEFKAPISLNETILIKVFLKQKRRHSFSLEYQFYNNTPELKAVLQTVHVCLDNTSRKKVALPDKLFKNRGNYSFLLHL